MQLDLKPKPLQGDSFSEASRGFFSGKTLPGVHTYSTPNFPGDVVDGGRFFTEFTRTPVYYPKRNEEALIQSAAPKIIRIAGYFNILVDLGCGDAFTRKVRHFMDNADYGPLDTNKDFLDDVAEQCNNLFPDRKVIQRQQDFMTDPIEFPGIPFPVMLGSTITNFGTTDSVRQIFRQVKPLAEQGNGSFVFSHDTNTDPASLALTYTHELMRLHTLNVLHKMKRDLNTENFDPTAFGFHGYWEESTSSFNICMYPLRDMTFAIDGEWFSLKKDQMLVQAALMKLPADLMQALAREEGFDHYDPIYDQDGHIALQHMHL